MASASAGHIILSPTQLVGSGRLLRRSNPGPHYQESRAIPTELPPPPPPPHFRQNDASRFTKWVTPPPPTHTHTLVHARTCVTYLIKRFPYFESLQIKKKTKNMYKHHRGCSRSNSDFLKSSHAQPEIHLRHRDIIHK